MIDRNGDLVAVEDGDAVQAQKVLNRRVSMMLLEKKARESAHKKTIIGASVLLRRGGASPTDLPLASYLI